MCSAAAAPFAGRYHRNRIVESLWFDCRNPSGPAPELFLINGCSFFPLDLIMSTSPRPNLIQSGS